MFACFLITVILYALISEATRYAKENENSINK